MTQELNDRCHPDCGDDIIIRPVHWAPVMENVEDELWDRLKSIGKMRYKRTRRFVIDFLGDAFAYQIGETDRRVYDRIHQVFAQTLHDLARDAGENAPLCVIAHSLGSVIASNFIYDLQRDPDEKIISDKVRTAMSGTPLERGETLADFGKPIVIPDARLKAHYPKIKGAWVNFYDADDVIGFPIKPLNHTYGKYVTEDRQVNVGGRWTSWNPASHIGYWTDKDILDPIADKLVEIWKAVNLPLPAV
jgi:hypothetical protein